MTTSMREFPETVEPLPGVGSTFSGPFEQRTYEEGRVGFSRRDSPVPNRLEVAKQIVGALAADGYGGDPNLVTPRSPWPMLLTLYERHVIAALSDIILPATASEPAPSDIGIADFFDDWLSAPYDVQKADRMRIRAGLDNLYNISRTMFESDFLDLTELQRVAVLDRLIAGGNEAREFFIRFRYLVVGGYFTSDVGMPLLGYRGNIPLRSPTTVSSEALSTIEKELLKLGL